MRQPQNVFHRQSVTPDQGLTPEDSGVHGDITTS